ncbi:MAG: UDP-N-acetylmuramoyl-L-alanyl-D-glutamate--2,6-diaminopimelate ligase [Pseudomonadota bacterium]
MTGPAARTTWTLQQLLAPWLAVDASCADFSVGGITADSRAVCPGDLFLACAGRSAHGLIHAETAVAAGAAAIAYDPSDAPASLAGAGGGVPLIALPGLTQRIGDLAARFFGDPSQSLRVIGITGTNGKTSCAHLLAQTLGDPPGTAGLMGTLGNGFPDRLAPSSHTTLDAVRVQSWLARLREAGARAVAMEVSSHALDQGRVSAVRFDTAIFTNLTRDHMDYHGTEAAYAAAKRRLFERPELRLAVLWAEDPAAAYMAAALPASCPTVWASFSRAALQGRRGKGLWARSVQPVADGVSLMLESDWGAGPMHLPLLGRFNVANALLVLGALLGGGMSWGEALSRLSAVQPVPGRMQRLGNDSGPTAVVDYAHTPDAIEQAILACRAHGARRVVCVFGCGGDRDRGKRPLMGAAVGRLADAVVLTDDNPRSEAPEAIIAAIRAGVPGGVPVHVEHDRRAAIRGALAAATTGDWVLIAGKGHETSQVFADREEPFSDLEVVKDWFREAA